MAGTRGQVRPSPGERGLASHQPGEVAALLDPAWECIEGTAERIDLDAGTRLAGWTARQVLVHLGSWDEDDLGQRVAEARGGVVEPAEDTDARNARLVSTHHDASRDEVLAALRRARRATSDYLLGDEVEATGTAPVASPVGELPLTGLLVARAYELAVHALDLVPAGAPAPEDPLVTAGLAALADVTGSLLARRELVTAFAVLTPVASWVVGAADGDWTTARLEPGRPSRSVGRSVGCPSIEGLAVDVLDASAGRVSGAQLLLTRRLRGHDVPGLLQLLPAIQSAQGLPGGSGVRAAADVLAGAGRAVTGLSSLLPRR